MCMHTSKNNLLKENLKNLISKFYAKSLGNEIENEIDISTWF